MNSVSGAVSRTVAADYNRQTEMADWCRSNFVDGTWGFEISGDRPVNECYEPRISTWVWYFIDASHLGLFAKRWPWVEQYTFSIRYQGPLWRRFDEIKAWGLAHGIEIEEVQRDPRRTTYGPNPKDYLGSFHVLHVRFPENYDHTQFVLTWL